MKEGIVMVNQIKSLLDSIEKNPHWLSRQSNVTYRIVLGLYKSYTIPPTTSIGTLWSIASALGVGVDDLYKIERAN